MQDRQCNGTNEIRIKLVLARENIYQKYGSGNSSGYQIHFYRVELDCVSILLRKLLQWLLRVNIWAIFNLSSQGSNGV